MTPVIKASRVAATGVPLRQHPRVAHAAERLPAQQLADVPDLAGGRAPMSGPESMPGTPAAGAAVAAAAPGDDGRFTQDDLHAQAYDAGFAAGRQEGWDAGREMGMHDGMQQGRQDADAAATAQAAALAALGAAIAEACTRRSAAIEAMAIEIAFAALSKLIGQSAGDPAVVTATVQRVLEQLPDRALRAIRVSPAHHALLTQNGHALKSGSAILVADERVLIGGCIVDTDAGSLDGRLETQLLELKTLLVGLQRAHGAPA